MVVGLFVLLSVAGSVWLVLFGGIELLQSYLIDLSERVKDAGSNPQWLVIYALVCFVSQLLIIPSGSLILIAAGFIFSPLLAMSIFSVAQVLCSFPIYKAGEAIGRKFPDRFALITQRFRLPAGWEQAVQSEGLLATVALRLTPVIPSAAACLLASGLGIRLGGFIVATIAVCWIRPLFFASIGGSLQALTSLSGAINSTQALRPLLLLFIASLVLFLVKLLLRYRALGT